MASDILAAASLAPDGVKKAAEAALELKTRQHDSLVRTKGVTDYIETANNMTMFQPDYCWDDMLSSAPLLLSVMGAIYTASTAPEPARTVIVPPRDGFKYITTIGGDRDEVSLQATLVQINSFGDQGFELAGKNMNAITSFSGRITEMVRTVQQLLGDPQSAQVLMQPTVYNMRNAVKTCGKLAREVAERYERWLGATCEVYAALCQSSAHVTFKQRVNVVHLAAKQTQRKESPETTDSGWDALGADLVDAFAATAASAFNQAIPAAVLGITSDPQARDGFSIFDNDHGAVKDVDSVDHSNVPRANSKDVPAPTGNVLPEDYDDVAYCIVQSAYGQTQIMANLLCGKGGNVDWDSIASDSVSQPVPGIVLIKDLLNLNLRALSQASDTKKPTADLKNIINKCLSVLSEIEEYTGQNSSRAKPSEDGAEVKRWKAETCSALVEATAIWQISQTLPGARLLATPPPSSGDLSVPEAAGLQALLIGAATTKLESSSSFVQSVQERYRETGIESAQAGQDFAAIQAELSNVDVSKVSLDQVRVILLKYIELIIQFQHQINILVASFDAIENILSVVSETLVDPLLAAMGSSDGSQKSLGGYPLLDFCSILLFNSMLNVRSYLALFSKLAKLHMEIDLKYLRPGQDLLNELRVKIGAGSESDEPVRRKRMQLNQHTTGTLPKVRSLVVERQQEIMESLQKNLEEIVRQKQGLPECPPQIKKQIDEATQKSAEIALKGIKASNSYARAPLKLSA